MARRTTTIENTTHGPRSGDVRAGFTLAEAMMAMVILSMAAAGVLLPFSEGAAVQADAAHRVVAARLAADLMEQIVNKPFDQVVSAYNYSESQGQVKDAGGAAFTNPQYAKFSRDVSCAYYTIGAANFILATVRVYYNGSKTATIQRLIAS